MAGYVIDVKGIPLQEYMAGSYDFELLKVEARNSFNNKMQPKPNGD